MATEAKPGLNPSTLNPSALDRSTPNPSTLNPSTRSAASGAVRGLPPRQAPFSPSLPKAGRSGAPLPSRSTPAKPVVAATAGPVILFTAGGMRFAVEAGEVAEIRDCAERGAFNGFKAAGAIDFAERVGLGAGRLEHFVVLKPSPQQARCGLPPQHANSRRAGDPGLDGDRAGNCSLGVTAVERMTTLPRVAPLPALFRGAERQWYRGLLLLENEVVPLVRTEYWRQPTVASPQQAKCGLAGDPASPQQAKCGLAGDPAGRER